MKVPNEAMCSGTRLRNRMELDPVRREGNRLRIDRFGRLGTRPAANDAPVARENFDDDRTVRFVREIVVDVESGRSVVDLRLVERQWGPLLIAGTDAIRRNRRE